MANEKQNVGVVWIDLVIGCEGRGKREIAAREMAAIRLDGRMNISSVSYGIFVAQEQKRDDRRQRRHGGKTGCYPYQRALIAHSHGQQTDA
jgi:hypothetical protein